MTNGAVTQSEIDILSESALDLLIVCLRIAISRGGFEEVISVCKGLVDGAAKTGRPLACWAATEWRGVEMLVAKYQGLASNGRQHCQSSGEVSDLPLRSDLVSAKPGYVDVFKEAMEQMKITDPDFAAYLEKAGKTASMSGFVRSIAAGDYE